MKTRHLLFSLAILLAAFTLHSCKECDDQRNPDCDNYNPCIDAAATSATFTIKEATYLDIIDPNLADFLLDTDSCYFSSVYFEAVQQEADGFIWQVGSEVQPRYGRQVNVTFPDNLRGTTFNVRLIVKRKPNTQCFPNDDGIDTVTRKFYFVRFNEPLSWEGTYYGSDNDKPDSLYTIVLGHTYNSAKDEDVLKVFGIPRGCKDTLNERFGGFAGYKNVSFNRGGLDCDAKILRGVFKNGNTYVIRQEHVTMPNGVFTRKNRTFTGIKIN